MTTPVLRAELAKALTLTAETLAYLAAVWRELETRGEDLSELRAGMGQYLPMIAAGQLSSEAVIRFAGRVNLLRAVQLLPLPEQHEIATGRPVKVAAITPSGDVVAREVSATALTGEQIRLAFDRGRLRSVDEQRNMIESARVASKRRSRSGRQYKVKVDNKTGQVTVGRMIVSVADVLDALHVGGVLDVKTFQLLKQKDVASP